MKLKALALSAALGLAVVTSPVTLAQEISASQLAEVIASSNLSAEELVAQLIAQYPEMVASVVEAVVKANPEAAADVVSAAIKAAPASADVVVSSAMTVAPSAIAEVVQVAQAANISNEIITAAAIQAGADPTQIAQATAAGVPSIPDVPAPQPRAVSGS